VQFFWPTLYIVMYQIHNKKFFKVVTGPPNGPVLFCSLASVVCRLSASSVVFVTLPAGGPAGRPPGASASGSRYCTAGQYVYVPLGRHLVSFLFGGR